VRADKLSVISQESDIVREGYSVVRRAVKECLEQKEGGLSILLINRRDLLPWAHQMLIDRQDATKSERRDVFLVEHQTLLKRSLRSTPTHRHI